MALVRKLIVVTLASLCLMTGIGILFWAGLPERDNYSGFTLDTLGYVAPEINNRAPPFTLADMSLNPVSLSDYDNQIIIINFWATWCIPCRVEMQELQDIHDEYDSQIQILGVNLGESPQAVAQWIDELSLTYEILLDPSQSVAQLYQIRGQPSTYIIDTDGIIRQIYFGPVSMEQLETDINTHHGSQ